MSLKSFECRMSGPRGGARGAPLGRRELAGLRRLREGLRRARGAHLFGDRGALGGLPELLGRLAGALERIGWQDQLGAGHRALCTGGAHLFGHGRGLLDHEGAGGAAGVPRRDSSEIPRNPSDLGKRSRHFEAFRVNFSRDEVPGAAREVLECAAARAHELLRLDAQRSDPEPPGRGVFTRLLEGVSRRFKTFRALRSDSEDTNILDYNLPQTPLGLGSRARLD